MSTSSISGKPGHNKQPNGQSRSRLDLNACLQTGFALAYFIVQNRATANNILAEAFGKLDRQCKAEAKRTYWRQKWLKHKIFRIVRKEPDVFQWLICFACTPHEIADEKASSNARDLAARYIKHLAQITTPLSSFHVAVGFERLLYSYSTQETQKLYEWLADHYLIADAYRAAKRNIMNELAARFDGYVSICTMERGEHRFKAWADQERWRELVEHCLKLMIPWTTRGACQAFDTDRSFEIPRDEEYVDALESHRCHPFIEPRCHQKLTDFSGVDAPTNRLALPEFFNVKRGSEGDAGGLNHS